MRLSASRILRRRSLPHHIFWRTQKDGTVSLWSPASRRPVWVRGDQVFGERSSATTGNTTSSNDDFFLDVNDLFGNLNMDDNIDANAAAAAQAAPYVTLSSLCQILLEFLVLAFGVDVIGLSCLDMICSSILLVCMISLITVFIIMLCLLFIWIKSYGHLLIYSTIQKLIIGK
jgi:hypothetical protein